MTMNGHDGTDLALRRLLPASRTPRLCRLATLLAAVLSFMLVCGVVAPGAGAVTVIDRSGTLGPIYGWGGTVCNPFRSGGFASRYIEIGSPLVSESAPTYNPDVHVIGGGQAMRWQPWLEKYVGDRWVVVWVGPWYSPISYQYVTSFGDPMLDVYSLGSHAGRGYFRTGGTVIWVGDSQRASGGVRYRHTAGNYFKDGYADRGGAYATPVQTGYCWAG